MASLRRRCPSAGSGVESHGEADCRSGIAGAHRRHHETPGRVWNRYVGSEQDSETRGIGAAQRWIEKEFKSYSPKLEVSLDHFSVKKSQRVAKDVELANVVAVLPGTVDKDRYVIIGGHYDTIALRRTNPGAQRTDDGTPANAADVDPDAPGVADDASGTAATMELARVMSQYQFDKSIIFIAFAAEEIGLNGSKNFADEAKEKKMTIEAMLNNDIIGTDVSGNGSSANGRVRIFSEGPEDSPSRAIARYAKEIGERYVPSMTVDLIFRRDRFSRGGDHTSFVRDGFAAVRFTTPSENYANQHTATDTFASASVPYTTRVAKVNAAVLASLAWRRNRQWCRRLRERDAGAAARVRAKDRADAEELQVLRRQLLRSRPRGALRWRTVRAFRAARADTMPHCVGRIRIRSRIWRDTRW